MGKTAIITGQDGAYLSQLLLEKGYGVIGLVRSYIALKAGNHGQLRRLLESQSETELELYPTRSGLGKSKPPMSVC